MAGGDTDVAYALSTVLCAKVRLDASGPAMICPIRGHDVGVDSLLRDMGRDMLENGDQLTVDVVEMTESELEGLEEFPGW
ncbi:MAG: hypothetical protein GTN93_00950 [Anaerolineae bacterium]|nr:hypothetical protein [Anaerolineae bacterium]